MTTTSYRGSDVGGRAFELTLKSPKQSSAAVLTPVRADTSVVCV